MRFMMLLKSDDDAEAGVPPDAALLAAMGKYNDELIRAGVLLDADGLQSSAKGARVRFSQGKFSVAHGPFPEPRKLIAGYWMIQVKSKDEAIAWAERVPFESDGPSATRGGVGEIELRPLYELSDFPQNENESGWREQEEEFRAQPAAAPALPAPSAAGGARFIALLKADENTEAGVMPDEKLLTAMGELMAETAKAGALLSGEGFHPSSRGTRVRFEKGRRTVADGPFPATGDLVAGYSVIRARSRAEAVEWAKRCLAIHVEGTRAAHGEIEVRQIFEACDFGQ